MAYQVGKKRPVQILRTPAPRLDLKNGGEDYGEANAPDTPASIPPGVGGPQSKLGQNLRDSVDDDVLPQVIAKGTAGRGDQLPSDDNVQQRAISATPYEPSHGLKRQQVNLADVGKNSLPKTLGASAAPDPTDPYAKG